MRVTDPDGKAVCYILGPIQTMGRDNSIAPGKTVVLFDELDLTEQHLFVKAGPYTLQFRGDGAVVRLGVGNSAFQHDHHRECGRAHCRCPCRFRRGSIGVPPEGWDMTFEWGGIQVEDGKIALSGGRRDLGRMCRSKPGADKDDVLRVGVWVAERKLAWTGKARNGRVVKPGEAAIYLGKGVDGHVYLDLPRRRPKRNGRICRTKVRAALQIEPLVPEAGKR